MTIAELIKELSKYPPYYEARMWCDHSDNDWEIKSIEYNKDNYPRIVFIVEGDD